jgi:hypothetical protein
LRQEHRKGKALAPPQSAFAACVPGTENGAAFRPRRAFE